MDKSANPAAIDTVLSKLKKASELKNAYAQLVAEITVDRPKIIFELASQLEFTSMDEFVAACYEADRLFGPLTGEPKAGTKSAPKAPKAGAKGSKTSAPVKPVAKKAAVKEAPKSAAGRKQKVQSKKTEVPKLEPKLEPRVEPKVEPKVTKAKAKDTKKVAAVPQAEVQAPAVSAVAPAQSSDASAEAANGKREHFLSDEKRSKVIELLAKRTKYGVIEKTVGVSKSTVNRIRLAAIKDGTLKVSDEAKTEEVPPGLRSQISVMLQDNVPVADIAGMLNTTLVIVKKVKADFDAKSKKASEPTLPGIPSDS